MAAKSKPDSSWFDKAPLMVSVLALSLSGASFYLSISPANISFEVSRFVNVAMLPGNHLSAWSLPYHSKRANSQFLIVDSTIVIRNKGGTDAAIKNLELTLYRKEFTDELGTTIPEETLRLQWEIFIEKIANSTENSTEIVNPIIIPRGETQKASIRFLGDQLANHCF